MLTANHTGSLAIAYGIAAALFKRAVSGEPSVVENSLLATATWVLSGDLTLKQLPHYQTHPKVRPISPLMFTYRMLITRWVLRRSSDHARRSPVTP